MSFCNINLVFVTNKLKFLTLQYKESNMATIIHKAETLFERFEHTLEVLAEKLL